MNSLPTKDDSKPHCEYEGTHRHTFFASQPSFRNFRQGKIIERNEIGKRCDFGRSGGDEVEHFYPFQQLLNTT
jgi:hypothetical protein